MIDLIFLYFLFNRFQQFFEEFIQLRLLNEKPRLLLKLPVVQNFRLERAALLLSCLLRELLLLLEARLAVFATVDNESFQVDLGLLLHCFFNRPIPQLEPILAPLCPLTQLDLVPLELALQAIQPELRGLELQSELT